MAKYGLDLGRNNKTKKRKNTIFVIAFLCFAIVLGSVSTLLLWRSLNYDFNNIFNKDFNKETSDVIITTTEKSDVTVYSGGATFLTAVISDDKTEARFINLININLDEKTVKVIPVDDGIKDSQSGLRCGDLLEKKGAKALVEALSNYYGVKIDKYAVFTESGFKSVFKTMGNITVKVNNDIEYDTEDMFLELQKGENILTPEKVYKYMKYICETENGYERSRLTGEIIVSSFKAFFNGVNFALADEYFSKIINYCDSDISIVDYTEAKDKIEYLLPVSAKDVLKVFVSSKELNNEEK